MKLLDKFLVFLEASKRCPREVEVVVPVATSSELPWVFQSVLSSTVQITLELRTSISSLLR